MAQNSMLEKYQVDYALPNPLIIYSSDFESKDNYLLHKSDYWKPFVHLYDTLFYDHEYYQLTDSSCVCKNNDRKDTLLFKNIGSLRFRSRIKKLPDFVKYCDSLTNIRFIGDDAMDWDNAFEILRTLPIKRLEILGTDKCKLSILSSKIGLLDSLKVLILSHNQLQFLPDSMRNLHTLRYLDVSFNPDLDLSAIFPLKHYFPHLFFIMFAFTAPISAIPKEIFEEKILFSSSLYNRFFVELALNQDSIPINQTYDPILYPSCPIPPAYYDSAFKKMSTEVFSQIGNVLCKDAVLKHEIKNRPIFDNYSIHLRIHHIPKQLLNNQEIVFLGLPIIKGVKINTWLKEVGKMPKLGGLTFIPYENQRLKRLHIPKKLQNISYLDVSGNKNINLYSLKPYLEKSSHLYHFYLHAIPLNHIPAIFVTWSPNPNIAIRLDFNKNWHIVVKRWVE